MLGFHPQSGAAGIVPDGGGAGVVWPSIPLFPLLNEQRKGVTRLAFSDKHWSSCPRSGVVGFTFICCWINDKHMLTSTSWSNILRKTDWGSNLHCLWFLHQKSGGRRRASSTDGKTQHRVSFISSVKLLNARAGTMITVVSVTDLGATARSLQRGNHSRASVSH